MIQSAREATRRLPGYASVLDAYHCAQRPTLRRIVSQLPIRAGDRVLDVPCGDGYYGDLLAAQGGHIVGADLSGKFLDRAHRRDNALRLARRITLAKADVYHLPFASGSFDLVWCAHSMISLSDPRRALREIARVLRPEGSVAVLEQDPLHHVLAPWPPRLEVEILSALLRNSALAIDETDENCAGRGLLQLLREVGFRTVRRRTFATDHEAPLQDAQRQFVDAYLQSLRKDVRPELPPQYVGEFDRLTDPGGPEYLPDREDFALTCIDFLLLGRAAKTAPQAEPNITV